MALNRFERQAVIETGNEAKCWICSAYFVHSAMEKIRLMAENDTPQMTMLL